MLVLLPFAWSTLAIIAGWLQRKGKASAVQLTFLKISHLRHSTIRKSQHYTKKKKKEILTSCVCNNSSYASTVNIRERQALFLAIAFVLTSTNSSLAGVAMTAENQVQQIELLTSTDDDHGGVIVEMDEPMDPTTFASILRASISHWKQLGKKGVWMKLPIHLVNLVEALVKEGFWYHHAEPKYLMLVHWIAESANTIPANATHRVGVGALVFNDKQEVLVVQEKSGYFQGTGFWKFPTGIVDQGEDIGVAVVREVKEETGVDSEFVEVLAFRQSHKTFFEKSDLFFVCMLRPLSFDIKIQELEIEAAQWMPFGEYAAQPLMEKLELMKYINEMYLAKIDGRYSGFTPVSLTSQSSEQKSCLYLNAGGLKRCNSL